VPSVARDLKAVLALAHKHHQLPSVLSTLSPLYYFVDFDSLGWLRFQLFNRHGRLEQKESSNHAGWLSAPHPVLDGRIIARAPSEISRRRILVRRSGTCAYPSYVRITEYVFKQPALWSRSAVWVCVVGSKFDVGIFNVRRPRIHRCFSYVNCEQY
jgi:hypothetical protein